MKKEKEIPLYFNASVLIEDTLYFTAVNSVWLYALHLKDGKITPEIKLPCQTEGFAKFSSLIHYSGKIWMVPWDERDFMIYDMEQKAVVKLPLPKPLSVKEGNRGIVFRKAVKQENILWLLPSFDKSIVKIDMEKISCEILGKWAEKVAFDEEIPLHFKCMYGEGKDLYLFADGCKNNLTFDTETCEVRTWGSESCHAFGAVNNGTVYLSPAKSFDCIKKVFVLPTDQGKEMCQIKLPDEIWEKEDPYAYWYSEVINGKIYFLPHTANAIIIMDMLSEKIDILPLKVEGYQTLREYKGYAGYEVIPYQGGTVITSMGNAVLLEKDGKIVKEYLLKMPDVKQPKDVEVQRFIDQFVEREIIGWSKVTSDIDCRTEEDVLMRSGKIGVSIYEMLTGKKE